MKTFILKSIFIALLIVPVVSCTNDSITEFDENRYDIKTRSKTSKEASSYTLVFQKEAFDFDSKRDLYSFLVKKDPSTAIFLAEVIVSDLNQEFIIKYGEEYMKDLKIWGNFEKDLEDELETEGLPSSYRCLTCTVYPEECEGDIIYVYFAQDYFKLSVYDDAQYQGDNYLFNDSKVILMTEYDICTGLMGTVEIPSLTTRGILWNDKISSFDLSTELWHDSAVLTLYSERDLTGSEYVFYMSEDVTAVSEPDLSDNYWNVRNFPVSVDNKVSSVGLKFVR